MPKHDRVQLLKGHKRVEEETSSRKENYKILVGWTGGGAQVGSVNTNVSFGAQFTSFMCIK